MIVSRLGKRLLLSSLSKTGMTKSNHNFVAIIGAIVICYCYAMTQMKHGKEGLFTLKPRRLDGIGGVGMDGNILLFCLYYLFSYTYSFVSCFNSQHLLYQRLEAIVNPLNNTQHTQTNQVTAPFRFSHLNTLLSTSFPLLP